MLCLISCALNGSLNAKHGYVFIRNRGTAKSSASIMNDSQAQSNAGSMLAMALAFCGDVIAQR
jgi:hypothetical protein